MKTVFQLKALPIFVCAFLISTMAWAQKSPHLTTSGEVAGAKISIRYGSPYVKGRKIWGGLEAYDKVYRAGADSATTFTTSKDIKVNGKALPAGKYSFFVIPSEKGPWTVIFNKTADQWGAYNYDASKDQLRVTAKPKKSEMHEQLTYIITPQGFSFNWDKVSIPVSIK